MTWSDIEAALTEPGTEVTISVKDGPTPGYLVEFDSGLGMSPEQAREVTQVLRDAAGRVEGAEVNIWRS